MMEIPMGFNAAWSEVEPVVENHVLPPLPPEDRKKRPRTKVTIRLDRRVLAAFRALGPGYQAKMNEVLLKMVRSGLEGL